jgi:hypothetical protein
MSDDSLLRLHIQVAIEAMKKEIKSLNVDANLHERYGAEYMAAVQASRRRCELREAIKALAERFL